MRNVYKAPKAQRFWLTQGNSTFLRIKSSVSFLAKFQVMPAFPFTIISLENQRSQLRNTLLRKVRPTRKLTRNRDKIIVQSQNLFFFNHSKEFCVLILLIYFRLHIQTKIFGFIFNNLITMKLKIFFKEMIYF